MKVAVTHERHEKHVGIRILDSTERVAGGYRKDREFRPEKVSLSWSDVRDGNGWQLSRVRVSGSLWKKDGTVGQIRIEHEYGGWRREMDQAPQWLLDLVAEHAPAEVTA